MSSILKALRKIGEEKRADQHAAPDLRLDQGLTPAKSKPFLPLLIGIILGAVVIGPLYLIASKDSASVTKVQPVAKDQPAVKSQPVTKVQLVAKPAEPVIVETKSVDSAEISKTPVVTLLPEPVTTPAPVITPKPVTIPEQDKKITSTPTAIIPVEEHTVVETPLIVEKSSVTIQKPAELAVVSPVPSEAPKLPEGISLVVTEIFYNEDSANSMAVINELPVMIGTHVDSAVVAEIRPDSVLFMIDGNPYVVDVINP